MYKLIKDGMTGQTKVVFNQELNLYIPFDPANTDYQEYLKWLEEDGNQPLPADEPQQ